MESTGDQTSFCPLSLSFRCNSVNSQLKFLSSFFFLFFLFLVVYCTQPPVIDHARHNAPTEQSTFPQDTSLQYQCFPGYVTKGFARTKCFLYNGTAKWFGPDITCERKETLSFSFLCRQQAPPPPAPNLLTGE